MKTDSHGPGMGQRRTRSKRLHSVNLWMSRISSLMVAGGLAERVVHGKDGDSIVVVSADREVNVRIADMDAPELDQPYGREAKDALVSLVGGREVRLELVGGDVYRRIVANVFVGEGDVAAELVRRGLACVRRASSSWRTPCSSAPRPDSSSLSARSRSSPAGVRSGQRHSAAIDHVGLPSGEARPLGEQEAYGLGDFLGPAEALEESLVGKALLGSGIH
jgi:endonuclease YncB( thermonuclease family)